MTDLRNMISKSLEKEKKDRKSKKKQSNPPKKGKSKKNNGGYSTANKPRGNPHAHLQKLMDNIDAVSLSIIHSMKKELGDPDGETIGKIHYLPVFQVGMRVDIGDPDSWNKMSTEIFNRTATNFNFSGFHPQIHKSILNISEIQLLILDGFMDTSTYINHTKLFCDVYLQRLSDVRASQGTFLTNMESEIVLSILKRQYIIDKNDHAISLYDVSKIIKDTDRDAVKDEFKVYTSQAEAREHVKKWLKKTYRL